MIVTCTKDFSLTVIVVGVVTCGFWKPAAIDRGTQAVGHDAGDLITWSGLPEGAYQLVFVDHVYLYGGGYWIPNVPPPGGVNVLDYADNGAWAGTGLPTQPASFLTDPLGSADYHTYGMPGFFQQLPNNTNSIAVECVATVTDGFPQFSVQQTQELAQAMPDTLTAVTTPVSLATSRFRLTYGGDQTAVLAFTANAATVQGALNALASITADGGVVCAGALATGMTITWNVVGNRTQTTSSITTMSPAYYGDVVTTQEGTLVLPEIQTVTVAPWCTSLISFPAQPAWAGGCANRNLWDVVVFHHWFEVAVASYSLNPPPGQMEDIGVVDAYCQNICGPEAPAAAPTAVAGGAGNVEAGTHVWTVEFFQAGFVSPMTVGESGPSPTVSVTLAVNSQVDLSGIPTGPAGTTARYIFRTVLGDPVPRYVGQIADNLTTIFTDNVADATVALGNPVQASSHFWNFEMIGVVDPFSFGAPYGFTDVIWRGVKLIGSDPVGRYYPWPPRSVFGPTYYHANPNHGIPYYDVAGVF